MHDSRPDARRQIAIGLAIFLAILVVVMFLQYRVLDRQVHYT